MQHAAIKKIRDAVNAGEVTLQPKAVKAADANRQEERPSFLEKRSKKLLLPQQRRLRSGLPAAASLKSKGFLVLFFKKEHLRSVALACIPCMAMASPPGLLDVSCYTMTFEETFSRLSVSANGPGTKWTAHTPWHGDFGDAQFVDPTGNFPFEETAGGFRIEMRKESDGRWRSGLLASVDPAGDGFAQRYGYFEMRARLPSGRGVWPAFWLDSLIPKNSHDPSVEIDVMEQYGQFPAAYNSTVTVWPKQGAAGRHSAMHINPVPAGAMSDEFHDYGVSVDPASIVFYFDRREVWRVETPAEHTHKLMILADLGLGGGWPIDRTPSPSFMYVDYIRAYMPIAARSAPTACRH